MNETFQEIAAKAVELHERENQVRAERVAHDRVLADAMRENGVRECSHTHGSKQVHITRSGHVIKMRTIQSADSVIGGRVQQKVPKPDAARKPA